VGMPVSTELLDRLLDPVGRALGAEAARRVLALRADPELQGRMDELAERANEGLLTADERGEYEALIATATVVAVLQAKARAALAESSAA
jgi:predicted transcriptional regulator